MLVSVIIPCFNVEAYIEACILSVFKQTYPSLEVICVDNNSTDKTVSVILALKEKFPQLILTSESKEGASAARNKGLSLAKGAWVQFLDADDLLEPEKLEHQVNLIGTTPGIHFIAGSSIKQSVSGLRTENIIQDKDKWIALATNGLGNTCSNLFHRDFLLRINGWNEDLKSSQETDLMFRLLKQGADVAFDYKPLTIIRSRDSGSISQVEPENNLIRYIEVRGRILNYLKSINYNKEILIEISQILFDKIRELYKQKPVKSVKLFNIFLTDSYLPSVSDATTASYIVAYKWLGFKNAQKIKTVVQKYFS